MLYVRTLFLGTGITYIRGSRASMTAQKQSQPWVGVVIYFQILEADGSAEAFSGHCHSFKGLIQLLSSLCWLGWGLLHWPRALTPSQGLLPQALPSKLPAWNSSSQNLFLQEPHHKQRFYNVGLWKVPYLKYFSHCFVFWRLWNNFNSVI